MALSILFDMDGVIFDTERLAALCWQDVADRHGIEGIEQVLMDCTGVTEAVSRQIFARAYGDRVDYDAFRAEAAKLLPSMCPGGVLPMKPGARELLEQLNDAGVPTALASSTKSATVLRELREAGIDACFDAIICGDMVAHSKPDPEIFLTAAARLCAKPEDCIVVEDSHNGIRAAHAAGMRPIMVPDRMPVTDEMRALAEAILPDLFAVGKMIAAMP